MRRVSRRLSLLTGALVAGGVAFTPRRVAAAEGEVLLAVVVAPQSKLKELSLAELRRVFTGERLADPDGNKLLPFNHPPQTVDRSAFDRLVLKMDPDSVAKFWIDRKIRGGKGAPSTVESLAMLRRVVERLPGAVGYLRTTQLTTEVRALRIDGMAPGDPGYPLRYRP